MILPNIRASFGREDALHLVELLGRSDPALREAALRRLERDGVDALLDDPRVLNALLSSENVRARPSLIFYVVVRQALQEGGCDSPAVADFIASLVLAFGRARRAWRVSEDGEEEFHYLVDLVGRMAGSDSREAFLLRTHLGNHALWLAGLFPDYVEARTRRRGAPGLKYYERLGSSGYRLAAGSPEARAFGVDELLGGMARDFGTLRSALNRVSDRYLWREGADPVGRLLREVTPHGSVS